MPAPLLRGRLAVNRGSIAINAKALNNPGIRPKKRQSIVNPTGIALNLKGDRDLLPDKPFNRHGLTEDQPRQITMGLQHGH